MGVIRVMSRRVCLGLKTRPVVEVRPLSLMSTPVTHSTVLSAKTSMLNSSMPVEKRLQQISVDGRRHYCKAFGKINADVVNMDSHFMNDLGLDSLDHVELI